MEYVFDIKGGRRVVVIDDANSIMVCTITKQSMVRWNIIEREYHSQLAAYKSEDDIYLAYITVGNELVWRNISTGERLILLADKECINRIKKIQLISMYNKIYLFYQYIEEQESSSIRFVLPEGDRKSYMGLEKLDKKRECHIVGGRENTYILMLSGRGDTKYYHISCEAGGELEFHECVLRNVKEMETLENKLEYNKQEFKKLMNINNKTSQKCNELMESNTELLKKYNELTDLTKKIQEEGKYWRDLYNKIAKST